MADVCRLKGRGRHLSPIAVALSLRNEEILHIPLPEVGLIVQDGNLCELRIDGGLPRYAWCHCRADIERIFNAYAQFGDADFDPQYKILMCPAIVSPGEHWARTDLESRYRSKAVWPTEL